MFASQVGSRLGAEFIAGVNVAAEEHDINLVHFIGGKLTPIVTDDQNKLSFGLYDLAKPGLLDGLLLTADVAHGVSPEHLKTFSDFTAPSQSSHSQYRWMALRCSSPTMSRGCVAVRHLIEEHGYKRIALIRGIRGQIDAEQRSQAYQDELKAHNLHVDQNLVVHGDYTPGGTAAIRTLLDERRLRPRWSPRTTAWLGALEALQQRGLRARRCGCDRFRRSREAQATGVPLTTVRQSFYTAGNALEILLKRLGGFHRSTRHGDTHPAAHSLVMRLFA